METGKSLGAFDNLLTVAYVAFITWLMVSIFILAQVFVLFLTGVAAFLFSLTILLLFFALIEGFRRWLKLHNGPEPRKSEEEESKRRDSGRLIPS